MKKPNNYENTQASGDFVPLELGGHALVIKEVIEMTSKTNKPMIKISFDTADSDIQPHYFSDQFRDDIRPDKKWPNNGTQYILTEDEDGNCSRNFKTFTTSAEKSNPGFSVQWGDKFSACFKGKMIGGIFGIVEEEYNGKRSKKHKLRWFRSVDKVKDAEVPEPKLLNSAPGAMVPSPDQDGFMNIPDGIEEELPFN